MAVNTATEKTPPTNDRLPEINEYIIKRYRVLQVIGDGGYGTVLSVLDEQSKNNYAVKTEKFARSMLHIEVAVLRAARQRRCKHFAQLIDQGSVKRQYVFIVMTLLGRDLHKLRNDQPARHFTPSTALRVAIQTLEALQELHQLGFLSRDVKPGNFVIGNDEEQTTIFLIDFGLARKYMNKDGSIIPTRGEVGWRGTARYGSLQAHLRRDLGRKDDIESWLYMSIELYKGSLPWRLVVDRTQIHAQKLEHRSSRRKYLFEACPIEYNSFLKEIDSWNFEDEPKYSEFLCSLNQMLEPYGSQNGYTPYDWEDPASTRKNSTSISDKAQRRIGGGTREEEPEE
jgi:tau tubulin kinase